MKASKAAVLFVLLAVLASLVCVPQAAAWDNLLQNPGFEEGTNGDDVPDAWTPHKGTLGRIGDDDFVRNGEFAAKLTTDADAGWIYQDVDIEPGASYSLEAYYATEDDSIIDFVYLGISWWDEAGEIAAPFELKVNPEMSAAYHTVGVITATAPAGARTATKARVIAGVQRFRTEQSVTVYFDDLSFTGPPPSTPTPTPTQISTPTATIPPTPGTTPSPTPAGTTANRGDVLINEVQYDPPQTGSDADFEWVELFNATGETIHLDGWQIKDKQEGDLIPSITLSPNDFAVIAATTEFYRNFGDFEGNIVFLDDPIGNGLSNDEDRLILEDSAGNIIDDLHYGGPDLAVAEGHSLERSPAGGEFVYNAQPTPGRGLAPSSTPIPAETPVQTATPTVSATETPTATPSLSSTPEDAAPPPASAFSGAALRAVVIVLAIAFLGIVFWLTRRRAR